MKRNGRAPSGAQRWRCRSCGASATHSNDVAARELAAFVGWLLSRGTQAVCGKQNVNKAARCI